MNLADDVSWSDFSPCLVLVLRDETCLGLFFCWDDLAGMDPGCVMRGGTWVDIGVVFDEEGWL